MRSLQVFFHEPAGKDCISLLDRFKDLLVMLDSDLGFMWQQPYGLVRQPDPQSRNEPGEPRMDRYSTDDRMEPVVEYFYRVDVHIAGGDNVLDLILQLFGIADICFR